MSTSASQVLAELRSLADATDLDKVHFLNIESKGFHDAGNIADSRQLDENIWRMLGEMKSDARGDGREQEWLGGVEDCLRDRQVSPSLKNSPYYYWGEEDGTDWRACDRSTSASTLRSRADVDSEDFVTPKLSTSQELTDEEDFVPQSGISIHRSNIDNNSSEEVSSPHQVPASSHRASGSPNLAIPPTSATESRHTRLTITKASTLGAGDDRFTHEPEQRVVSSHADPLEVNNGAAGVRPSVGNSEGSGQISNGFRAPLQPAAYPQIGHSFQVAAAATRE
jgi:hypothetical protein